MLREQGSSTRSEFESLLAKSGVKLTDLTVALELPSSDAVLVAVAAGHVLSLVSERAAAAMEAARWIRSFPLPDAELSFAVLVHPDRHMTRAKQVLLDLLPEKGRAMPHLAMGRGAR